jgi:anaerobic magnesium-protoporphyrin IX monomethyl ester cyclase
MDILLTHAYFLAEDPVEQRIMKPYAPLGILSIASYLKQHGFEAILFDTTFRTMSEFEECITRWKPRMVGISINMMTKFSALKMIAIAKSSGAFVIAGGPEPASYCEDYLAHGVDVVVVGEGELTVAELLHRTSSSSFDLADIEGIVFRRSDGQIIRTRPRAFIADYDQLPIPDRSQIDMAPYLNAWKTRHGVSSLSLITMRGCPYTCRWCSHAVYGESYRRRSPRLVVDEIEQLLAGYAPDMLWFADDVFTISHKWLFELEKELNNRKISLKYECISRADRINNEVALSLKNTGCARLWIGSESGSQQILDAMSRGVRVEEVQSATGLLQKHGIEVGMFIMLGYPEETREDIERTIKHVKASRPEIVLTTLAYPIKGTPFYQDVETRLQIPEVRWSEMNDRMVDFSGRYSKRFYWYANRRVIQEGAWSRLLRKEPKDWFGIAASFAKAKVAHIGMMLTG